ncbi:hypothetical protein LWF01_11660 [Saxibacter everestensis]|uniref:Uncharacterized protein n=1 Tax=Saxibacter everestensis TaxID=2909229 RepID=A0ABY8QQS0_9MICO|nr:hypothetical protein LWF01_11660 [Brevibacteriaceae bacterium ZFBP1038]
MHFALLMLATVITSSFPLPWKIAALAFAIATIVFGIRSLIKVIRARIRGAMLLFVSLGLAIVLVMSVSLIGNVAFWPIQSRYENCLASALTDQANKQCQSDYMKELENLVRLP